MPEIWYLLIFICALLGLFLLMHYNNPLPLEPVKYKDVVSYVIDGDTVILKSRVKLRLWGVDAPENGAPGYTKATDLLRMLVKDQSITYIKIDEDRYGRTVARIFLKDGSDVNRILIEKGVAKEYCKFSKNYYGTCV